MMEWMQVPAFTSLPDNSSYEYKYDRINLRLRRRHGIVDSRSQHLKFSPAFLQGHFAWHTRMVCTPNLYSSYRRFRTVFESLGH